MFKTEPPISKFMTQMPNFIRPETSVHEAREMMDKFNIRHLPVVENDAIIGIVSDRDLKMAIGILGADSNGPNVKETFCHGKPYVVDPSTPLSEVADTMAKKHYGSCLIAENGKLVGIFTTVDACKTLVQILHTYFQN